MAFESLLNVPKTESELVKEICHELQQRFFALQGVCFFLRLKKGNDSTSSIVDVKIFSDAHHFTDYYWDTKFQRACFLIKFSEDHYKVMCQGNFLSSCEFVYSDQIEYDEFPARHNFDRENSELMPRKIFEEGFGEIENAVASLQKKKGAV